MAKKFKEIEVNDPVKVKVLNKYWLQGTIESLEGTLAVVKVPTFYGYASTMIINEDIKNLKPILLKEDKK